MSLSDDFTAAKAKVENLSQMPSTDELLRLYALYKQSTSGDVSGKRPGMLDMKGRAKYDAWSKQRGTTRDDAMRRYVALVDELHAKHG